MRKTASVHSAPDDQARSVEQGGGSSVHPQATPPSAQPSTAQQPNTGGILLMPPSTARPVGTLVPYWGYDQEQNIVNGSPNFGYQDDQGIPNRPDALYEAQVNQFLGQISDMMQCQFGLKPKNVGMYYKKPYPESFDQVPLPHRYKILDFTKFTGTDSISTREHIS